MPYQITTLSQLLPQLEARYESTVFWTPTEATNAINEALRTWNILVSFYKGRKTFLTVANQVWYPVPAGMLFPFRMDGVSTPLVQTTFYDLDLGRPNWEGETTATAGVPSEPALWVPAGVTRFALWPADAIGGSLFTIDGLLPAPVLVGGGDYIDLGEEAIGALLDYALHLLSFKVGGDTFTRLIPRFQHFLAAVATRNERLFSNQAFRKLLGKYTDVDSTPGPAQAVPKS
jgi:hypothetical protein